MYIPLAKCHLFDISHLFYHETVQQNQHKLVQGINVKKHKQINVYMYTI